MPKFRTKEDEAGFWDTHDFTDYWHLGKELHSLPSSATVIGKIGGVIVKNYVHSKRLLKKPSLSIKSNFVLSGS